MSSSSSAAQASSFGDYLPPQPAWIGRITETYNMLWKMVIRPPRDMYSPDELGPSKFRLGKRVYERRDLQLKSTRGTLECSHFVPSKNPEAKRPCVVYLHGNCSSRLEAFDALPVLLPRDLTVFCLDLSGSGRSDSEYISLGFHEEKDLSVVLQHLRATGHVSSIGLWGRSMGATTSILRAAQDHELAACVLDSAFGDLRLVAEELVSRGRLRLPHFLVNMAFEMIRQEVQSRANFDPAELMPIRCAPNAVCPAMFAVASDDSFVLPHHTQDLHNAWAGERLLRVFDGGHNGVRPAWFLEEAADFLTEFLWKHKNGEDAETTRADAQEDGENVPVSTPRLETASRARNVPDADLAAGSNAVPSSTAAVSDDEVTRRKNLGDELVKMGFGREAAARASGRCSSLEEAVEWILKKSDVLGVLPQSLPVEEHTERPTAKGDEALEKRTSNSASQKGANRRHSQPPPSSVPGPAPPRSDPLAALMPPGATMLQQLRFLGFDEAQCQEASRHCGSAEAAVEWLGAQSATVAL